VLLLELSHVRPNLRLLPVPLEKIPHPRAGVTEQGLVDEVDGGGGALDVQQDGADLRQRDAVRSGM
jgi:hypothetical protein